MLLIVLTSIVISVLLGSWLLLNSCADGYTSDKLLALGGAAVIAAVTALACALVWALVNSSSHDSVEYQYDYARPIACAMIDDDYLHFKTPDGESDKIRFDKVEVVVDESQTGNGMRIDVYKGVNEFTMSIYHKYVFVMGTDGKIMRKMTENQWHSYEAETENANV